MRAARYHVHCGRINRAFPHSLSCRSNGRQIKSRRKSLAFGPGSPLHFFVAGIFRRPQPAHVLGIEGSKRRFDPVAEAGNSLLNIGTKKRDPNFAAGQQSRPPHRARTSWMRHAIKLHSLHSTLGLVGRLVLRRCARCTAFGESKAATFYTIHCRPFCCRQGCLLILLLLANAKSFESIGV